jgi:uncharacterized protein YajQ (UPF0234 family)
MPMPSFDIVSNVDAHELTNAVDQANREVANRFDFKGTGSKVEQDKYQLTIDAPAEFQVNQVRDLLEQAMTRRSIDIGCLERGTVMESGGRCEQQLTVRHGIDSDLARKIVKQVKDLKLKVQTSIQGDQLRVSGKKRDDLQTTIAALKNANVGLPLQFVNFRD